MKLEPETKGELRGLVDAVRARQPGTDVEEA
jgi:hypothetical protein